MNKKEVVKQIEELIVEKENLLEGDELDAVFEYDILVLKNALKFIEKLSEEIQIYKKGGV